MVTDFWGVVVPNWIAATGGLLGTALAVVSLIVALRARGTADKAVSNDAETREAVAIVAKPPVVTADATVSAPVANAGVEAHPPAVTGDTEPTPEAKFRTSTDQEILDHLLEKWDAAADESRASSVWAFKRLLHPGSD